ncbi:hypothetical protein [Flavobacterium johnsoniae]|uniref:hypothetical protein n=1 Tax=Flavobacterium johnsoniae TaxID=986 RepID=UPI000A7F5728|nr:hypothetical protein [Flavobacterium johnsoniae]
MIIFLFIFFMTGSIVPAVADTNLSICKFNAALKSDVKIGCILIKIRAFYKMFFLIVDQENPKT